MQGTGEGGYISGDGSVVEYPPADRGKPIELTGDLLDGQAFDLTDLRGKVVVVNVWWSGCGPCRLEAPLLVGALADAGSEAAFVGINTRDNSVDAAIAFEKKYDVTYPSLYDPTGQSLLAFSSTANMRSTPSTVVLDRQGRVAAAVAGPIPTQLTLTQLVEKVAAERD